MAVAYGSLPFKEQIAFFRAKKDVLTDSYLDVWETQHDVAFMVAGANRADLLADLRTAVDKAISTGSTLETFRQDFAAITTTYGWNYNGGFNWRTRVIYETNLRQSYNAGRWAQLQQVKQVRPFWRYRHNDAVEHPRPLHVNWNGLVLSADDPWWNTHYPANGWGCQCFVEALNARDLKRLGKSGPDTAPEIEWQDRLVGQRSPGGPRLVRTPAGIDPGFAYAPGQSLDGWPQRRGGPVTPPSLQRTVEQSAQTLLEKTERLPLGEAAALAGQALKLGRVRDALVAGYAEFQSAVMSGGQARNLSYVVGALDAEVATALTARGVEPVTAAIVARDVEVLHALRDAKDMSRKGVAAVGMTADELAQLPELLRNAQAVLLDVQDNALLFVGPASDRRASSKVVVRVNFHLKLSTGKEVTNAFRTASLIDLVSIRDEVNAGVLVLLKGKL